MYLYNQTTSFNGGYQHMGVTALSDKSNV